jgi:tripartite-type tricarboxylate transporter receptor subunit TctC
MIAKTLSSKLGQQVIVENKPGASGIVGAEYVLNAKPDGYTLLYAISGPMGGFAFRYKKLSFNPNTAFTPVHGISSMPMLLVVRADAPYKTLAEFVAYAKKNPEGVNYFSLGRGDPNHLYSELLQGAAGFKMTPVLYKGAAPALNDLLAGVIQATWDFPYSMMPHLEAGKLRALGVTTPQRIAVLPDVPTFAEQGYPEAVYDGWFVIAVSAATPKPIVERLATAVGETVDEPAIVKYFTDQGAATLRGYSGEKLKDLIGATLHRSKDLLQRAGVEPE